MYHTIPLIKEMFYDLELEEECAKILDEFPWLTSDIDASGAKSKTNNIQMRTKVLGKGQKSKSRKVSELNEVIVLKLILVVSLFTCDK